MSRTDLLGQRTDRELVDRAIALWTRPMQAADVVQALQAVGIAAHEALDTPGLHADEQLKLRRHYYEVTHEIYQTHTVESSRLRLSRSPEKLATSALCFGRDNQFVLETILGLSKQRIEALTEAGVLS